MEIKENTPFHTSGRVERNIQSMLFILSNKETITKSQQPEKGKPDEI